jgi:hypothetical protein
MDSEPNSRQTLDRAIAQLLRPLFRVLLRHGVSFGAFEALAKRAYVEVAYKEFAISGKKPSISRASILSGLTRKEVQRLVSDPSEASGNGDEHYNRAAKVLTAWIRDAEFLDDAGAPRPLEPEGDKGFAGLVRRHSGDMPPRAVLDELLRAGAVGRRADGRVEPLTRAYVPQRSDDAKVRILGADVADLIATIDHNLQHGAHDPRFQRKVMYHRMPAEALPAFRALGAAHAQALLETLDRWLAAHDVANPIDEPDRPLARVGVGIYYFEERLASSIDGNHAS